MPDRLPPVRLDFTISLPMLGAILVAVGSMSAFLSTKLDTLSRVVVESQENSRRLNALEASIKVIEGNSTRNRQILEGRDK